MSINLTIKKIRKDLPKHIQLIIISKKQSHKSIMQAYNSGIRNFGESRVQELLPKKPNLPEDICWHMVGHIQTNKIKYIAPFIHTIHSIDSLKLLKKVNAVATKNNRIINCLLQVYIAQEPNKFGFHFNELKDILSNNEWRNLNNISIIGLMGMATFSSNKSLIRAEFKTLKDYFDILKAKYFSCDNTFKEISMGMSGDYKIAVEEGSTMIRIGSLIFNSQ